MKSIFKIGKVFAQKGLQTCRMEINDKVLTKNLQR